MMSSSFPYRTRRTIKPASMDRQRDVSRDLLVELLEDAHWAPTHGLTQPWRFHVFAGEARDRLASELERFYDQITPAGEVRSDKRVKLRESVMAAPVCVAVAAHVERGGKIPELDEICATACAVENLMLSAHQRGIGSFWSTSPVTLSEPFKSWLGLESTTVLLGMVYLGYAKDGMVARSARVPLSERVTFHDA